MSIPSSSASIADTAVFDRPAGLPGLAELVCALRHCAQLPGLLIRVEPDLGGNAGAFGTRCDRTPRIELGADLLHDADSLPLYGVLAHEIAHHALGHDAERPLWQSPAWWSKAALLAALVLEAPLPVLLVLAVVALAAALATARRERLAEYDADAHAVRLLDAAGLPGRRLVAAALADLVDGPAWYRLTVALFDSHPSARARRRVLASDRPAPRLAWALLWQRIPAPGVAAGFSCPDCGLNGAHETEAPA
ncbi:M48 family metalloprotease [Planomonospora sp. ID91781]|uniref:M48 family metalloprotease n=1 Tax=Planomonospora sp. ID91781 TaxID=2738135 RepID=UPI0018C3EB94|nr:M48 family metalloprotease [Planomonospora sp. ID91781]MBG0819869.1 M48 family metalloprotease [Planomonospora sp. ID91781]